MVKKKKSHNLQTNTNMIWGQQGACYLYVQKALCALPNLSKPHAPRASSHSRTPRTACAPQPPYKAGRVSLSHTRTAGLATSLKHAPSKTNTPLTKASPRPENTVQTLPTGTARALATSPRIWALKSKPSPRKPGPRSAAGLAQSGNTGKALRTHVGRGQTPAAPSAPQSSVPSTKQP